MSGPVDPIFAQSVGAECRAAADHLWSLQQDLSGLLDGAVDRDALVSRLQVIDALHQTMTDLSALMAALATSQQPTVWTDALGVVRQSTLRGRLEQDGKPMPDTAAGSPDDDIDLW
ncbi:hypothetical protein [Jannaschia sp. M317]|uniref:hypothetical protein n=1 Tax=Jannaschia sp. M317 TaxID=2867011 RepID=UPI0021A2A10C|nr:hypothetical protein [Jannaschia sp. M317]UWQ16753.1 hypothetical protein K3551_12660 [Jannaschia sp. M317]